MHGVRELLHLNVPGGMCLAGCQRSTDIGSDDSPNKAMVIIRGQGIFIESTMMQAEGEGDKTRASLHLRPEKALGTYLLHPSHFEFGETEAHISACNRAHDFHLWLSHHHLPPQTWGKGD